MGSFTAKSIIRWISSMSIVIMSHLSSSMANHSKVATHKDLLTDLISTRSGLKLLRLEYPIFTKRHFLFRLCDDCLLSLAMISNMDCWNSVNKVVKKRFVSSWDLHISPWYWSIVFCLRLSQPNARLKTCSKSLVFSVSLRRKKFLGSMPESSLFSSSTSSIMPAFLKFKINRSCCLPIDIFDNFWP